MSLQASIASLRASIMSVHCPPRLYFEPLKLLNVDFNADSDVAFHSNPVPDPDFNYTDPDPEPCWEDPPYLIFFDPRRLL
jgi:hypothetical protein